MLSLTALLALVLAAIVARWLYARHIAHAILLSRIPTVKFEDGKGDGRKRYLQADQFRLLIRSAYQQYTKRGLAFKVKSSFGAWRVVLPPECLEQMKNVPDRTLSWQRTMHDIMMMSHTSAPDRAPWSGRALRVNVTKRLGSLREMMIRKINEEVDSRLTPSTVEWQTVPCIHDLFQRCIAGVVNEVFCGPEFAADPQWVEMTMNLTANAWRAAQEVRRYPAWQRWFRSHLSPLDSTLRVARDRQRARQRLIPIFRERTAMLQKGEKAPDDALQWLIEIGGPGTTAEEFSDTMSRVMMASIHTTANMITWALANLLHRPEYLPPMLSEMRECFGGRPGVPRTNDLDMLRRLDSFIMESARFTPLGVLMVGRQVLTLQPYAFNTADGTVHVPRGVSAYAAVEATLRDADIYERPDEFDGNRSFEKRRSSKIADQHWKLANATQESLYFGYGVQACPGRWFAKQEMLLILSKLIMDYEMEAIPLSTAHDGDAGYGRAPEPCYHDASMRPPNEFGMKIRRKETPEFPKL